MLALTLSQAKAFGFGLVVLLIAAAIAAAMLAKAFMQKLALVVILGLMALLVWTQRASLDECADKVKAAGLQGDTTCTFLGRDVEISRQPHMTEQTDGWLRPAASTRTQLITLTAAKTVANAALRWVGPFLPTLEKAFSTTTGTLTGIMGVCELGGLTTTFTGPTLDRGHERRVCALGLVAVSVSSAIALGGTVATFAVSFALLIIGVGNLTAAGHAWIGHRIPFAARSRAIGAYEMSWAIALLIGAPILALLIEWFGWRGPYVALLIASAIAAVVVMIRVPPGSPASPHADPAARVRLPTTAYLPMFASAAIAASGLGVFIVSGAWLDDVHHVSTGGLGLVAAGFGAVGFVASGAVAGFADRVGVRRSVAAGLGVLGLGIVVIAVSGDSRPLAVAGLATFLLGFEFGFVSSLTLVTEAAPEARGKAIGISNSIGTLARAGAVILTGQLYEAYGMAGSLTMVSVTASAALLLTIGSARQTR